MKCLQVRKKPWPLITISWDSNRLSRRGVAVLEVEKLLKRLKLSTLSNIGTMVRNIRQPVLITGLVIVTRIWDDLVSKFAQENLIHQLRGRVTLQCLKARTIWRYLKIMTWRKELSLNKALLALLNNLYQIKAQMRQVRTASLWSSFLLSTTVHLVMMKKIIFQSLSPWLLVLPSKRKNKTTKRQAAVMLAVNRTLTQQRVLKKSLKKSLHQKNL